MSSLPLRNRAITLSSMRSTFSSGNGKARIGRAAWPLAVDRILRPCFNIKIMHNDRIRYTSRLNEVSDGYTIGFLRSLPREEYSSILVT